MSVKSKKPKKRNASVPNSRARGVAKMLAENKGMSVSAAMRANGYSPVTSNNPQQLTRSKQWAELMEEYLPEENVAKVHKALLNSHNVDHMTFPLETPDLTDAHITELLANVNCTVRRIAHGEQARHVYFFSPDNRARKDALDMVYKLRGSYAAEKHDVRHFSLLGLGKKRDEEMIDGNKDIVILDSGSTEALDAP